MQVKKKSGGYLCLWIQNAKDWYQIAIVHPKSGDPAEDAGQKIITSNSASGQVRITVKLIERQEWNRYRNRVCKVSLEDNWQKAELSNRWDRESMWSPVHPEQELPIEGRWVDQEKETNSKEKGYLRSLKQPIRSLGGQVKRSPKLPKIEWTHKS